MTDDSSITIEMLKEAIDLIQAIAPPEAPSDAFLVRYSSGLRIIKNDMLPENTVIVSKRLFDLIYEANQK